MIAPDAAARLDVPRGNVIDVDPRSRGTATVGERDHQRLTGLDTVRSLAILMVLFTHIPGRLGLEVTPPLSPTLLTWGGNGVSLFFALSGYLLWRPFVTGRPSLRQYLLSRAGRILPAYWLAVVVLVTLRGGSMRGFLLMLEASPNTYPLGVMWTLQAEVMFYFALPFLALIRRPLLVPIVLGVASLALELNLGAARGTGIESALPVRFWAFAPGMILAAWQPRTNRWWLAGGLALMLVGAATLGVWGGQWADVPSTIGAGLIVAWGFRASPSGRWLWSSIAAVSYGLYLWHVDIIELFGWAGIPLLILIVAASYLLLERPVMRWVASRRRVPAVLPERREPGEVVDIPLREHVGRPGRDRVLPDPLPIE